MRRQCRHFGECGGCLYQNIPYEKQVSKKQDILNSITAMETRIINSSKIFGFRNKMEYSFEDDSLGLHPRGRFDKVVDLKECPVFSDWVGDFLQATRNFSKEYSIPFYSRKNNNGIMRYLILRESKFNDQVMIILVVNTNSFRWEKEWLEMVRNTQKNAVTVILARRHQCGDTAVTEDYDILSGSGYLRMSIGDKKFDISPFSFFQPNSYQIKNMYDIIAEKISSPARVLDLFSGIGTIALYIGGERNSFKCVECYETCIKDAVYNKEKLYPLTNIEFVKASVRTYTAEVKEEFDYVIIDPPRGGMSYRVWKHLVNLQELTKSIKRIFYISCSLRNLQDDINFIKENTNWKVTDAVGVDQFVHTPHLETVVEIKPEI